MFVGLDYLAGAHYESTILKAHQPGVAAGFLFSPFKDPLPTAAKMARRGREYVPLIRIHRKFEYDHDFPKKEWGALEQYTKAMNAFALQYPTIDVFYSPTCENNLKRAAATELMLMCSRHITARNLQLVNSIYKGAPLPGIVDEVHGIRASNPDNEFWFKSADGIGGTLIRPPSTYEPRWTDINIPVWMNVNERCAAIFGWNFRFNLKYGPKDKRPVEKRNSMPSVDYIKGHTRPLFPIGGKQELTVTWKPFADDHGGGEASKDNKAMCILPDRVSRVKVHDAKGAVVDELPYFGTYDGGGYRYYSKQYAYKIAERAKRLTGSEFCTLRADRRNYGRFNPAFRTKPRGG